MSEEVSQEEGKIPNEQQHGKDYREPPAVSLLDMGELKRLSFYKALIADFVTTLLFLSATVATAVGHN